MKKTIAVLLLLVLAVSMCACGPKTETIYVQTQSLRTIAGREIRSEYTYASDGSPLEVKTYLNGVLYQTASTRTSGGIDYLTVVDDEGNSSTQSTWTTYDDRGNVTKIEQAVGGNTVTETTYTYDDQNRMLTAVTKTADGETKYSYAYDDRGNMTEQIRDDETTKQYTRTVYRYDDRSYIQEEKTYDREGVLQSSITYAYEADNTGRTATYYDGAGEPTGQVVTSRYDANGYLIQETTIVDGEVLQTIENTYEAMEIPVK